MERRRLGALEVSAIGLGCATMTPFYGEPDPESGIATIPKGYRARLFASTRSGGCASSTTPTACSASRARCRRRRA